MVGKWEVFEAGASPGIPAKLSATGRPPCVAQWIQRARAPTYRAPIADFDVFALSFTNWWRVLQPEWRRVTDRVLARGTGDWESIRKPGTNGLLSVLAALFFWAAASGVTGRKAWLESVEDVTWVIQQLVRADGE